MADENSGLQKRPRMKKESIVVAVMVRREEVLVLLTRCVVAIFILVLGRLATAG